MQLVVSQVNLIQRYVFDKEKLSGKQATQGRSLSINIEIVTNRPLATLLFNSQSSVEEGRSLLSFFSLSHECLLFYKDPISMEKHA